LNFVLWALQGDILHAMGSVELSRILPAPPRGTAPSSSAEAAHNGARNVSAAAVVRSAAFNLANTSAAAHPGTKSLEALHVHGRRQLFFGAPTSKAAAWEQISL